MPSWSSPEPLARDTWEGGDAYEAYIGRWSRLIANCFLEWLGLPGGWPWLDAGCGTGALTAAICEQCAPASVIGMEPSRGFLDAAQRRLRGRAALVQGTATAIPLASASIGAVVSGLVLNFVPDPLAAILEMRRVAIPGGTVALYVWDYADRMEIIRVFWDAAVALNPAVAPLAEGTRFPLCRPQPLHDLLAAAALTTVEVKPVDATAKFPDFDAYWRPFLGGQGPAGAYVADLDPQDREALRECLRASTRANADGSITLAARAWAIRGHVPQHE